MTETETKTAEIFNKKMSSLYIFRFVFLGNIIPVGLITSGIVFSILYPTLETVLAFSSLYIIAFLYMGSSMVNRYIRAATSAPHPR